MKKPIIITKPVAGEILEVLTIHTTVTVRSLVDSNMNTDVRFKLNGIEVGIDTTATNTADCR